MSNGSVVVHMTPSSHGADGVIDVPGQIAPSEPVLIVDSDTHVLRGMELALSTRCSITTAASGADALRYLEAGVEFAVVMSDLRMPAVSGLNVLKAFRTASPDTVRIAMVGSAGLPDLIHAVNDVGLFRVLTKPATSATVLAALLEGLEQHHALIRERAATERMLEGVVNALADAQAHMQPLPHGRGVRLKRHVTEMAAHLGIDVTWDVGASALLSSLGCLALTPDVIDRWAHGAELSESDRQHVARMPAVVESLLAHVPGLAPVGETIRRSTEPLLTHDMPMGARLLAVASDFDALSSAGESQGQALAIMNSRAARYDPRVFEALRVTCGATAAPEFVEVRLCHVELGMRFAADVKSSRGLLLIANGQEVTTALRERIARQWDETFTKTVKVLMFAPLPSTT